MKTKFNLQKLLAAIGLLAVAVPSSLAVVACGNNVVTDTRANLADVFSDFQFLDDKSVPGFLDSNNLALITEQVLKHLDADSLEAAGLILEHQTSNSIVLKATSDSKNYRGTIELFWNLKLMEINGIGTGTTNPLTENGLKGYFYLEQKTNLIKFFNVFNYFHKVSDALIHPNFLEYHHFIFSHKDSNDESKEFTINGRWWVSQLAGHFGSFAFAPSGMTVTITSPEARRVKLFDAEKNEWVGVTNNKSFDVDSLGQITAKE